MHNEPLRVVAFVPSTDLHRSHDFYVGVLGLEPVTRDPYALVLKSAATTIRVAAVQELTPQPFTILGWDVEDIQREVDVLTSKGVTFTRYEGMGQDQRGIWTSPGGALIAWFTDPDGNTLSLTQHP